MEASKRQALEKEYPRVNPRIGPAEAVQQLVQVCTYTKEGVAVLKEKYASFYHSLCECTSFDDVLLMVSSYYLLKHGICHLSVRIGVQGVLKIKGGNYLVETPSLLHNDLEAWRESALYRYRFLKELEKTL